ncbi:MAG: trypsin-like peptidase domain-containing protein [Thermoguttaceae bacterium]|nr:trypsin-like peptidase domain-containing protein [Thermoguttaceae bacterium]
MRSGIISMLLFLFLSPLVAGEPARTMEDLHAASCRVLALDAGGRGAVGTGTVCGVISEGYCVLTNWHVVGARRSVKVQFFGDGHLIESPGTVIASWHDDAQPYDFALITVPISGLAGYEPPYVPLAEPTARPQAGDMILSCGCSEGRWPMAWKGHIERLGEGTFQFQPAPKGGQSGSAIVRRIDGRLYITGVLTWRVGGERGGGEERMRGGAISIGKLYDAYEGRSRTRGGSVVPPDSEWAACSGGQYSLDSTGTAVRHVVAGSPGGQYSLGDTTAAVRHVVPQTGGSGDERRYAVYTADGAGSGCNTSQTAVGKGDLEVLFFTQEGCVPCREAEGIVKRYAALGYPIRTIVLGSASGREEGRVRSVVSTPTFIVLDRSSGREREVSRFTGARSLEQRLGRIFTEDAEPRADLSPIFDRGRSQKEPQPQEGGDEQPQPAGGVDRGWRDTLVLISVMVSVMLAAMLYLVMARGYGRG